MSWNGSGELNVFDLKAPERELAIWTALGVKARNLASILTFCAWKGAWSPFNTDSIRYRWQFQDQQILAETERGWSKPTVNEMMGFQKRLLANYPLFPALMDTTESFGCGDLKLISIEGNVRWNA